MTVRSVGIELTISLTSNTSILISVSAASTSKVSISMLFVVLPFFVSLSPHAPDIFAETTNLCVELL